MSWINGANKSLKSCPVFVCVVVEVRLYEDFVTLTHRKEHIWKITGDVNEGVLDFMRLQIRLKTIIVWMCDNKAETG